MRSFSICGACAFTPSLVKRYKSLQINCNSLMVRNASQLQSRDHGDPPRAKQNLEQSKARPGAPAGSQICSTQTLNKCSSLAQM